MRYNRPTFPQYAESCGVSSEDSMSLICDTAMLYVMTYFPGENDDDQLNRHEHIAFRFAAPGVKPV